MIGDVDTGVTAGGTGGSSNGVLDVSEKFPTSGVEGGNTYTLEGALAVLNIGLSASKKKGGMSIKFVSSSDNKYVQYRLMADEFTTDTAQWQGVDDEPTAGSTNLVKSGGVFDGIHKVDVDVNGYHQSITPSAILGYVTYNDGVYHESTSYDITNPIELKAGQTIAFKIGTAFSYAALSLVSGVGTENIVYTPVLKGSQTSSDVLADYSYTTENDCYVAVCYRRGYNDGISINQEGLVNRINDLEDKTEILNNIDASPIEGSNNLIKSGGVKTAIDNLHDTVYNTIDGEYNEITPLAVTGHILYDTGAVEEDTAYRITEPIRLEAAHTINFNIGTAFSYAALSIVNGVGIDNVTYTPVLKGSQTSSSVIAAYHYTAEEDCYVAICYRKDYIEGINITTVGIEGRIDTLESRETSLEQAVADLPIPEIFNVTELVPLEGSYYDETTSRAAVPSNYRKNGLIVKYAPSNNIWKYQMFYRVEATNLDGAIWSAPENWKPITFENSPFFNNDILAKYPVLSCIKGVELRIDDVVTEIPTSISVTYLTQGNISNQQIGLNLNHTIETSIIPNVHKVMIALSTTADDYSNVVFEGDYKNIHYKIVTDRSIFKTSLNLQPLGSDWADIVNYVTLPLVSTQRITKPEIFNVTEFVPLESGQYYDETTSRAAVPSKYRKNGLIVKYATSARTWCYQTFFRADVATNIDGNWLNNASWKKLVLKSSPFFDNDTLAKFPTLNAFKSIQLTQTTENAELPSLLSVILLTQGNVESQQLILNIGHSISGNNKVQSIVINTTASDYANVVFETDVNNVHYKFVTDRTVYMGSLNLQASSYDWADIVNYVTLPFVKIMQSRFIGGSNKMFVNTMGNDFLIDLCIAARDKDDYIYFPYIFDFNYNDNGVIRNAITISKARKDGTGSYITAAYIPINNYLDNNGYLKYIDYGQTTEGGFAIGLILNWGLLATKFDGTRKTFSKTTSPFSDSVFVDNPSGLLQKLKLHTLYEASVFKNCSFNLGAVSVAKDDTDIPVAASSRASNDGRLQLIKNINAYKFSNSRKFSALKGLTYKNLSTTWVFLDITWDGKIWFGNRTNGYLRYYPSVADVIADTNYVDVVTPSAFLVGSIQQFPYGLKMNQNGELIVVSWNYTLSWGDVDNTPRIWKCDSNFENWTLKATARTKEVGFSYPDWLMDIKGNRILISFYGGHYDDATKAPWHIYYSFDGGDTWYNNLFELGNMVDVDGWHEDNSATRADMHIHGISIDPFRNRLMVQNGDTNPSLWYSTNLEEWEMDSNRENSWSQSDAHTLHWKRVPTVDGGKYTSAIALSDCILLGTDSLPNGFQRINLIENYSYKNEVACSEPKWCNQRVNPDGTGDYGFYGYTLNRRDYNSPILCSIMYIGGVQATDQRRNMVFATMDGYVFSKIWEDDRDVVKMENGSLVPLLQRTNVIARQSADGYVLIQTRDSRFNPLVDGYPAPTNEFTLVIGKL